MPPLHAGNRTPQPPLIEGGGTLLRGLPPVSDPSATVLVLGSMPGAESLRLQQYYAHPRNLFWPIVGELFGAGPQLPYAERLRVLRRHGVAVWDVLDACRRPGSLDSAIEADSIRVNDFAAFFTAHPRLRRIGFNGAFAELTFRRRVPASVVPAGVEQLRLPSTSPANAAQPRAAKLAAWRALAVGVPA
jgi:hypoxanthine-DNA glycosylase